MVWKQWWWFAAAPTAPAIRSDTRIAERQSNQGTPGSQRNRNRNRNEPNRRPATNHTAVNSVSRAPGFRVFLLLGNRRQHVGTRVAGSSSVVGDAPRGVGRAFHARIVGIGVPDDGPVGSYHRFSRADTAVDREFHEVAKEGRVHDQEEGPGDVLELQEGKDGYHDDDHEEDPNNVDLLEPRRGHGRLFQEGVLVGHVLSLSQDGHQHPEPEYAQDRQQHLVGGVPAVLGLGL
mmetsp:Transcript_9273/g.19448  ORF Transcript_9273/g.19448 Transcript_9273/m.19448 type:complete len:233 (+) Transcript_9273:180-878(+)